METKRYINSKSLTIMVFAVILLYFSLQVIILNDDTKVLEKIRNDPRIPYTYIKLGEIETMAGVSNTLSNDPGFSFTLLVRQFTAFRGPSDTTPSAENSMILGYVDMNLKVWIIGELQGDEKFR